MAFTTIHPDGSSKSKILLSSLLFMGLGHLLFLRDTLKGLLFAGIEVLFLIFLPGTLRKIAGLITLGDPKPNLPMIQRDHSMFMMIDGIMTLAVVFIFILIYYLSVKSALSDYKEFYVMGRKTKRENILSELGNKAFPIVGLMPSILLVVFFVIVPLVFSACVAFTNYSAPKNIPPNNTVDWVGLDNFRALFGGDATWTGALGRVAVWTLVWATLATFTCYAGGIIMAVILQESKIKIKPLFRSLFILPYAIPTVVSMLIWNNLLNGSFGTINRTLIALGVISKDAIIPWLSEPTLAKFMCILVNLWAGFPYFMLLTMGTMTSIGKDQFEASEIDGASKVQTFRFITLPQVLYQTMPLIIMSFTFNINNFGAIFFLTGGNPIVADSTVTSARGTDIMVLDLQTAITLLKYNYASVRFASFWCWLPLPSTISDERSLIRKELCDDNMKCKTKNRAREIFRRLNATIIFSFF